MDTSFFLHPFPREQPKKSWVRPVERTGNHVFSGAEQIPPLMFFGEIIEIHLHIEPACMGGKGLEECSHFVRCAHKVGKCDKRKRKREDVRDPPNHAHLGATPEILKGPAGGAGCSCCSHKEDSRDSATRALPLSACLLSLTAGSSQSPPDLNLQKLVSACLD